MGQEELDTSDIDITLSIYRICFKTWIQNQGKLEQKFQFKIKAS